MYILTEVPDCRDTGDALLTPTHQPAWNLGASPLSPNPQWNTQCHSLEADKSKIKVPADLLSGECPLPGSQTSIFLLCFYMIEVGRELSEVSL